ncbi:MAG TPA: FmdB family zinc ribbon protein [Mycobacterium sp.]
MPTYSYACTECDDRFDAVQSFTEDTLTTCAKCAGRLRKLFNSVGVVFKGSGFYRTDSRDSGKGTSSVPSGGSESSGSGSSTEKSNGNGSNGSSDKSSSDKSSGEKSSSSSSSSKSAPATAAS